MCFQFIKWETTYFVDLKLRRVLKSINWIRRLSALLIKFSFLSLYEDLVITKAESSLPSFDMSKIRHTSTCFITIFSNLYTISDILPTIFGRND